MCLCVRACGWLGVGKIKSWFLRACFILVSFLVFLLCPGRCVQLAVCYTSCTKIKMSGFFNRFLRELLAPAPDIILILLLCNVNSKYMTYTADID